MIDFFKKYKNTDEFRAPAIHFQKHRRYTDYKPGTKEYNAFWTEQEGNCMGGFTSKSGEYITGFNYFFLNFCPMRRLKVAKNKKGLYMPETTFDFPLFYSYDAIYFNYIEECQLQGRHAVVLKARRKGYSYKNSSMLCRNYYFKANSKGYVFATDKKYLTGDGVLNKAWEYMSFIDNYTPFAKKRQVKNSEMHRRASYIKIDEYGNKVEEGYKSEIMGFSLKSNPDKLRGIAADLIFFEEGGSFGELEDAFSIARPSVEQDGYASGLICVYGTASMNNESMSSIARMFSNPLAYNILSVKNIWDEGSDNLDCGFFHPYYENFEKRDKKTGERLYMDEEGNTKKKEAIDYVLEEREQHIAHAISDLSVDSFIIERPIRPSEALMTYGASIFPKKLLQEQLMKVRVSEDIRTLRHVGELEMKDGKPKWKKHETDDSIQAYTVKSTERKAGAVICWEFPEPNPPFGLYIIGVDSYDFDASQTDSLGSCVVFKRFSNFETYHDMIVAEYTGRPEKAEDFYEQVRRLGMFFNARIMYENNNKGIYTYFVNKHCEYMLADQPDVIDKIVAQSKVDRQKGVHVTKDIRNAMNGWIREWIIDEYSDGHKNAERIFSPALLEELIGWNSKGNFDRVAALGCVMVMRQQIWMNEVKEKTEDGDDYKTKVPFFAPVYYNEPSIEMPEFFRL